MSFSRVADSFANRFVPLQDALLSCEHDVLVHVIMQDHVRYGFPAETDAGYAAMRKQVEAFLDAMCRMRIPDTLRNSGYFLLPETSYAVDVRLRVMRRWVSASLVDAGRVDEAVAVRLALGDRICTYDQLEQIHLGKDAEGFLQSEIFDPVSYSSVPWEQVLAWKVWLPASLCLRERYMVLASAVWEMAFYNLAYDWARDRAFKKSADRQHESQNANSEYDSVAATLGGNPLSPEREGFAQDERIGLSESSCNLDNRIDEEEMDRAYLERLARDVAVLNYNARIDYFDLQIQLAEKMALGDAFAPNAAPEDVFASKQN